MPVSISISKRINKDTIKIEIDDFKYEVIKDTLKIEVYLELTCDEYEIKKEETTDELDNYIDNYFESEKENNQEEVINNATNINNITNTIISNDNKYYTYKIYIVRQGDTYETICNKYNITLDDLKEYNDLNELNVGDKIIIPSLNE